MVFRIVIIGIFLSLAACSSLSQSDSDLAKLHLSLGTSQLQSGNYPQALEELLKAQELDSSNEVVQNNLGLAYFVRDRFDLAEIHVRKALAINPQYSDARNNLSRILIERGLYSEAATEARTVTLDLTYPFPEKPLVNLGMAYFKLKNFTAAKATLLKALENQRDNCLANSYYGRSLFELHETSKASDALDKAVGFCERSQFDEPHYYSGLAYFELGQKEKAEARLEELIKLYPQGKYSDKAKSMLETMKR